MDDVVVTTVFLVVRRILMDTVSVTSVPKVVSVVSVSASLMMDGLCVPTRMLIV